MRTINNILRTFYLTSFLVFACVLLQSVYSPLKAALIDVECISGECNLDLRINDKDINKLFPDAYPGFRVRVDLDPLLVDSFESNHCRILAYEQLDASNTNIISSHTLRIPKKRSRRNNYQLIVDIPEFLGAKLIFLDFYRNDGTLQSTYRTTINGFGSINSNLQSTQGIIFGQSLSSIAPSQLGVVAPSSVLNTRWSNYS